MSKLNTPLRAEAINYQETDEPTGYSTIIDANGVELFNVETGLAAAIVAMSEDAKRLAEDNKVLSIKAASSLANNLCPDHRDKQKGRPCLACEIEQLRKLLKELAYPSGPTHHARERAKAALAAGGETNL